MPSGARTPPLPGPLEAPQPLDRRGRTDPKPQKTLASDQKRRQRKEGRAMKCIVSAVFVALLMAAPALACEESGWFPLLRQGLGPVKEKVEGQSWSVGDTRSIASLPRMTRGSG